MGFGEHQRAGDDDRKSLVLDRQANQLRIGGEEERTRVDVRARGQHPDGLGPKRTLAGGERGDEDRPERDALRRRLGRHQIPGLRSLQRGCRGRQSHGWVLLFELEERKT